MNIRSNFFLFVFYFFFGFVLSFPRFSIRQDLRKYGINLVQFNLIHMCLSIPWAIKCIWAMISDNFFIYGYKRKPYLFIHDLIGLSCASILTLASVTNISFSVYFCLAFWIQWSLSWIDVLIDGILILKTKAESTKEAGKLVLDSLTFRAVGHAIGSVTSAIAWGQIGSNGVYTVIAVLFIIPFFVSYYLEDNPIYNSSTVEGIELDETGKPKKYKELIIIEGIKQPSDIYLVRPLLQNERPVLEPDLEEEEEEEDLLHSDIYQKKEDDESSCKKNFKLVIKSLSHPVILLMLGFNTITTLFPSAGGPVFFFVNEEVHLTPEQFSMIELISQVTVLSSNLIYSRYFKQRSIWHIYSWVVILGAIAEFVPYILTKQVPNEQCNNNLRNNETCYLYQSLNINPILLMISDDTISDIVDKLKSIPLQILIQCLCYESVEASTYSFVHSLQNTLGVLHFLLDAHFFALFDIDYGKHQNLPNFILVCAGLNLLSSLFFVFLPNKPINEIISETFEDRRIKEDVKIQEDPKTGKMVIPITAYEKLDNVKNKIIELQEET